MTVVGDLLTEFTERPIPGTQPPVLTLTEHNGFVRQSDRFKKRLALADTSGYKVVRRNDIAFNPYLLWAGAVAQNTIVDEGVISPLYPTFRVRDGHDPRFVARLLLAPSTVAAFDGIAFGSVPRRRRSSTGDFLALSLDHVPPLDEQRRIATILDTADALGTRRRAVLAHFEILSQRVLLSTIGDVKPTVPLGELVDEFRYGTSNKSGKTGLPALRIPNVIGGAIDTTEIKRVEVSAADQARLELNDGDLLFVRTNGNANNVGRCAVFDRSHVVDAGFGDVPWIYASYLIRARLAAGVDSRFLAAFLSSARGRAQLRERSKTSAGQYNVNIEGLGAILIPEVPAEAQRLFAARIAAVEVERMTAQRALAAHHELFASLQARAFSGGL